LRHQKKSFPPSSEFRQDEIERLGVGGWAQTTVPKLRQDVGRSESQLLFKSSKGVLVKKEMASPEAYGSVLKRRDARRELSEQGF